MRRIILCQGHWALWKGRNLYFNLHFAGMKLGKPVKTGLELLCSRLRCREWGSWNTTVLCKITLREILGCRQRLCNEWRRQLSAENMPTTESPLRLCHCGTGLNFGEQCLNIRVLAAKGVQAWDGFTIPKEPCVYGMNWTSGTVASCTVVTLGGNKKQWQWWTYGVPVITQIEHPLLCS